MNKKEKPTEFQLFYSEIPVENHANVPEYYYRDTRITHAYDKPRNPALSQDQLSVLAKELLREAKKSQRDTGASSSASN